MKLAAFVFALSLAACASLAPRPAPPQVALDSISAIAIGPAGAQARIRLSVQNPNGYDLAVESLEYTLTIDGRPLGGGALAHPVTLAANAATPVDLDVAADLDVLGKSLSHGIESLHHPLVDYVRGRGLLQGVVLTAEAAKPVEAAARDAGFLVNAATPDVIRLAPPLVITESQIDDFLTALPGVLDKGAQA